MEWVLLSEASNWDNSISLTYVFIMSFFIFTPNKMSDPVVVFLHSRGKEILGTMLLAKSICVMRENKWKLFYRFLAIMDLMFQRFCMCETIVILPQGGGRTQENVFLNCIGWDFWLCAIFEIIGCIFEEKKGFLERNFSMFQKMRGGIRKQKMRGGCGNVQKMREKPANCR